MSLFKQKQRAPSFTVDGVSIPAPAGWTEVRREADRLQVGSPDGRHLATLSTMRFAADPGPSEFALICEHRLTAERQDLEDGFIQGGEPQAVPGGAFVMLYSGGDKANGRLFAGFLSVQQRQLATLYFETIGESPEVHLEQYKAMAKGLTRV